LKHLTRLRSTPQRVSPGSPISIARFSGVSIAGISRERSTAIRDAARAERMFGRCRFFAGAAVGREKVNWTRRYSVYILRRNWFRRRRRHPHRRSYVAPVESERSDRERAALARETREQKRNPGIRAARRPARSKRALNDASPVCTTRPPYATPGDPPPPAPGPPARPLLLPPSPSVVDIQMTLHARPDPSRPSDRTMDHGCIKYQTRFASSSPSSFAPEDKPRAL